MQHNRSVAAAILADINGAEPFRHHEIKLQRAALPLPAERVAQMEFKLRAVEGAFAGTVGIGKPGLFDRRFQVPLGAVPDGVAADPLRRPVGEFDLDILEAEIAVDRQQ